MKTICYLILVAFILLCNVMFSQVTHTVKFSLNDLSFSKKDGYDLVRMKGLGSSNDPGSPCLPTKNINLIIPSGSDVESIVITKKESKKIDGIFNVYLEQKNKNLDSKNTTFVNPNKNIYASENSYPVNSIITKGAGYFDGSNRIVNIQIYPLQYNPQKGELQFISNLEFTMNFKSSNETPLYVKQRDPKDQRIIEQGLKSIIDNPEDIEKYIMRPGKTNSEYNHLKKAAKENTITTSNLFPLNANYLIITSDNLKDNFTSFINRKALMGRVARVFTIEDIYAAYPNGDVINGVTSINDNAGKIRQFLKDAHAAGALFVLLAGDHTVVPIRIGWYYPLHPSDPDPIDIDTTSYCPADVYFSDLNTNWNVDGDSYYGEPFYYGESHDGTFDPYPELYVGRIPFTTGAEITNWVNKVITYETYPFNGNTSSATKVLWTCADQMNDDANTQSQYFPNSFTHTIYNEQPSGDATNPTSPTGQTIISTLNQGYGFWIIHVHGNPENIAVRTSGLNTFNNLKSGIFSYDSYNPSGYENVTGNGLDNITTNCTIVYSCACNNGQFDISPSAPECMAKTYLKLQHGGSAFLGNTQSGGWTSSPELESYFFTRLFDLNNVPGMDSPIIGMHEAFSKIDLTGWGLKPLYVHHLFGDPTMEAWKEDPWYKRSINEKDTVAIHLVDDKNIPKNFFLYQNYPNPFNPSTEIKFDLPEAAFVSLKVYNLLGKEISTLKNEYMSAGYCSVNFKTNNLPSGIYIYKIITDKHSQFKKMMLLK